ncbi:Catsper1 [Symbiodinium natans]|uniref:Catsper1 protein n=1 Tax=Symbiodinium natans TaxID=878477 RepID=A0A812RF74_9DINO|nr:Catsper1 [Symbiodinium natans]
MSGARPAFAAGLHAASQYRRTQQTQRIPQALMTRISTSSANKILKASKTVEDMVANIVGRRSTKEDVLPQPSSPVESKYFQNFIYGTIMLNSVTLGLQADFTGGSWDVLWLVCENIFTAIFTVELVLKLYFLRLGFFYSIERHSIQFWNLLDLVIVLLAIVDCWVLTFFPETDTQLIRVMQLLRIMRIAKLLRLRRELVAIIEGLFCSLQCMVWIGFLMLIVIYAFGIFCRNVIGTLPSSYYDDIINNEMYFGSLPRTMLTLFNVCILDGWSTVVWPQMLFNPVMVLPLMVFLCVTCFGLMNALIGVIVERTTAAHQNMNTIQEEVLRESKMRMVAQLLDVIDASDEDESGTINLEEFREVQKKPYASEIFAALNLPPGFDASDLFGLLDDDGNGVLDRYEFLLGICRLIWCDEFQSQCLLNYGIAKVRQDVRNLHKEVQEILKDRNKPDLQIADLHKSISESLHSACQDILEKHLEQYWQRAQSHKDFPSYEGKTSEKERTDDEVSLLDYCTIVDQAQPAEASVRGSGSCGSSWPASSPRESPSRAVDDATALREEAGLLLQLPPAAVEVLESHLDELTRRTAARRISLNAAGGLFVEGTVTSKLRVKQLVQELLQGGSDGAEKVQTVPAAPSDARSAGTTVKRRRRRRRNHDHDQPETPRSPPSPPSAPPSPSGSSPQGEPLEVRVLVHPVPDEARDRC